MAFEGVVPGNGADWVRPRGGAAGMGLGRRLRGGGLGRCEARKGVGCFAFEQLPPDAAAPTVFPAQFLPDICRWCGGTAGGFDEQFRGGGKAGSGRQGSSGTGGVGHDARNNTERRGEPKRPSPSAPLDIPPTGRNLTAGAANLSPDAGGVQTAHPGRSGVFPEGVGGVGLDLWDGGVLNGESKV